MIGHSRLTSADGWHQVNTYSLPKKNSGMEKVFKWLLFLSCYKLTPDRNESRSSLCCRWAHVQWKELDLDGSLHDDAGQGRDKQRQLWP